MSAYMFGSNITVRIVNQEKNVYSHVGSKHWSNFYAVGKRPCQMNNEM